MIFSLLYDLVLFGALLLYLPKLLYDRLRYKKYKGKILKRLGLSLPDFTCKHPIWVHAVSVGEIKAVKPLLDQIKQPLVISTTTITGNAIAKELFPQAKTFILPLDFSFTMKKLIKKIDPILLILSESDLWYHLLKYCPKTCLVNGKISERSYKRFKKLSFFSKRLFSHLDCIAAQSEEYRQRFISLGVDPNKIKVTGNMKLDLPNDPQDSSSFLHHLHLTEKDTIATLGSTHRDEELLLLKELIKTTPDIKVLICPRHPERFSQVKEQLAKEKIDFATYSSPKPSNILLIDQMGLLPLCYQVSTLAIVGGSFIPGIGGHNIIEPIHAQCPVFFGPFMESQKNLVDIVLNSGAGIQTSLKELSEHLKKFFKGGAQKALLEQGKKLRNELKGSVSDTQKHLHNYFSDIICG